MLGHIELLPPALLVFQDESLDPTPYRDTVLILPCTVAGATDFYIQRVAISKR
ncbi:hypothetical protein PPGU19_099130 (plasmid) [Paraburkholderia sp. PGU19]|nr:hypothetical protein PPGU19_099130 [Paraburkholderia sp. PGU19]